MTVPDFESGLDTPTHVSVDETGAPLDAVSEVSRDNEDSSAYAADL
jgi:hypothetical protein